MSKELKLGYVYLLRVYPSNNVPVYKYGKTSRHFPERFKDYKQAQPIILIVLSCRFCDILEKTTLKLIKENYVMRPDIGREYFEGDLNKIKKTVINAYRDHVREYPCSETSDEELTSSTQQDLIEICNAIRQKETFAALSDKISSLKDDIDSIGQIIMCAITIDNRRFLHDMHVAGYDIFGADYEYYLSANASIRCFMQILSPEVVSHGTSTVVEKLLNDEFMSGKVDNDSIKKLIAEQILNYDHDKFKKYIKYYKGDHNDFKNDIAEEYRELYFEVNNTDNDSVDADALDTDEMLIREAIDMKMYRNRLRIAKFDRIYRRIRSMLPWAK